MLNRTSIKRDPAREMQFRLVSLPVELTEKIASFVEDDIFQLRLSWGEIRDKIWHVFKTRYFRQRVIWIERKCLQTLLDMSRHEILATALRRIYVTCHYIPSPPVKDFELVKEEEEDMDTRNRDLMYDQQFLRLSGDAAMALCESFRGLQNMQEVEFGSADGALMNLWLQGYGLFDGDWRKIVGGKDPGLPSESLKKFEKEHGIPLLHPDAE